MVPFLYHPSFPRESLSQFLLYDNGVRMRLHLADMGKRKAGDVEGEETGQGQLAKLVANPEKRLRY